MKKTINFARFSAELNTDTCDALNNAELTLTLRLGFRQINPPGTAATGTYNDYGDATAPARRIARWTPATWTAWMTELTASAQQFWNGKFWLMNDAGSFTYPVGTTTYVPNIYCKIKIIAVDGGGAGSHHTIDVVRLAPGEAWFGSHARLYDSRDINSYRAETSSAGRPIMQRAHVHEVGHLLGLGHVDIGQPHCPASGDTNLSACYGVSDDSKNSVMGAGMTLHPEHAQPWREAIRSFAIEEAMAITSSPTSALSLLVPMSRLLFAPSALLAV